MAVTPKLASTLPPREDPEERGYFLTETRLLFGDEVADELAERIKAQQEEEEHEDVRV